jgi:hypothetical protein
VKKRTALVVAAASAAAGLAGVGEARADFHGLCAARTAPAATVRMVLAGDTITYTGTVRCDGTSVTIDSVTFTAWEQSGRSTGSAAPASCPGCTGAVTTSGTHTPAGPGTYAVHMRFTVRTAGGAAVTQQRTQRTASAGTGNLVVLCGGTDQANQQNLCPVPDGLVAVP